MKKTILITILLTFLSVACGVPEKKPLTPSNNKTPAIRDINFEEVSPGAASKEIKEMADIVKTRDAVLWAVSDNKNYLIISQGDISKDYRLEVDEILQRSLLTELIWLDIKFNFKVKDQPKNELESTVKILRVDVSGQPKGIAFSAAGLDVTKTEPSKPASPAQIDKRVVNPTDPLFTVKQPIENQQINSPVFIQGKANTPINQLRVMISTDGGQIIKEESIEINNDTGNFSKEVKYNSPSFPTSGEITLLSITNSEEDILARIPVTIN